MTSSIQAASVAAIVFSPFRRTVSARSAAAGSTGSRPGASSAPFSDSMARGIEVGAGRVSTNILCLECISLPVPAALELEVDHSEIEVEPPGHLHQPPPASLAANVDQTEGLVTRMGT